MRAAIDETNRRRKIQKAHNKKYGITPKTIQKAIHDITDKLRTEHQKTVRALVAVDSQLYKKDPKALIREKTRQMNEAVRELDFETAALLRDELYELRETKNKKPAGSAGSKKGDLS